MRALSADKSVRMAKTMIHSMCKYRGFALQETAASIPELQGENGHTNTVVRYIDMHLKALNDNKLLPGQENALAAAGARGSATEASGRPPPAPVAPVAQPRSAVGMPKSTYDGSRNPTPEPELPVGHAPDASGEENADPARAHASTDGGAQQQQQQPLQPINAENATITQGLNIPEHFSPVVRCAAVHCAEHPAANLGILAVLSSDLHRTHARGQAGECVDESDAAL
jgi:hypothetical protein